MRLCVRKFDLKNQYNITEHDKDNLPIDYSSNIFHDPANWTKQPSSAKLLQFLSLTHGANDDQLLQLVRLSCPRPEAQLNSCALTRLCLIKFTPIPPRLCLFIARAPRGFIMTIYHT